MYRIGELAQLTGVTPETLRFYEQQGLLIPSQRSDNGYRLYSEQDKRQLQFILRGKQAGLSNKDMLELLSIRAAREAVSCRDVRDIIDAKLLKIRAQIAQLQEFETSLTQLATTCCGGDEKATHCSILGALDELME